MTGYDTGREQSVFNSSLPFLDRMGAILICCHDYRENRDLQKYVGSILSLSLELSTHMTPEEAKRIHPEIRALFDKVELSNRPNQQGKPPTINSNLFWELRDIELELRRISKAAGLETKSRDDSLMQESQEW